MMPQILKQLATSCDPHQRKAHLYKTFDLTLVQNEGCFIRRFLDILELVERFTWKMFMEKQATL